MRHGAMNWRRRLNMLRLMGQTLVQVVISKLSVGVCRYYWRRCVFIAVLAVYIVHDLEPVLFDYMCDLQSSSLSIVPLRPFVQHYDWGKKGSASLVAQLAVSGGAITKVEETKPYAELWMGCHPSGPCEVGLTGACGVEYRPIKEFLVEHSEIPDLPYLFKVLSVNKALSIQSHPDAELARELHKKRPDLYKDANPKPELAVALTPFKALFGFRPIVEIALLMTAIGGDLINLVGKKNFENLKNSQGLRNAYTALMTAEKSAIESAISHIVSMATTADVSHYPDSVKQALDLAVELNEQFPGGDVGVLSVFFLNIVNLSPGECLFMGPNVPHAYIAGDIVECMTSSDNVIRGGLTPKFKDVDTLVRSLNYESAGSPVLLEKSKGAWEPVGVDFGVKQFEISQNGVLTRGETGDTENDETKIENCANNPTFSPNIKSSYSVLLVLSGQGTIAETDVRPGTCLLVSQEALSRGVNVVGSISGFIAYSRA